MPESPAPDVLTKSEAMAMIRKWECLGITFPRTKDGFEGLAEEFQSICGTKANGIILSKTVMRGCSTCPTPIELRRIASFKFAPADELSASQVDMSDLMGGGRPKS